MSIALADALKDVQLEVGRTYRCEVRGLKIEVQVFAKPQIATGLSPDDVMLDLWCELPRPKAFQTVSVRRVDRLPFDIPEIPVDDDTELEGSGQ